MAVYTEVKPEEVEHLLAETFSLGHVKSFRGIPEGIENTNYYLETDQGKFILTLFEKRTPEKDLPYFVSLMKHLSTKKFPAPAPVKTGTGDYLFRLKGKPALLVTFLKGQAVMEPGPAHCRACGKMIGQLHLATSDFTPERKNMLDLEGCAEIFQAIQGKMKSEFPKTLTLARKVLDDLEKTRPGNLPNGTIHADLFPDNVFFQDTGISGVIDFYFAATDDLAYDLAVAANSWCVDSEKGFKTENFRNLVSGYEQVRPLEKEEKKAMPKLLQRAALRFLLTRAQDWLYPPAGLMGIRKDPAEYGKILSFHRRRRHFEEYV